MLNNQKKPLVVQLSAVVSDPALAPTGRGARKIGVTSIYSQSEKEYDSSIWNGTINNSPVMLLENAEYAVFSEITIQDRHYHAQGTEIYTVLSGDFRIEVNNELFTLGSGDSIIIPSGVIHEVLRDSSFVANVVTLNCGGIADKFIV